MDFDFFSFEDLEKDRLEGELPILAGAERLQDAPNTLVVLANVPSGEVKLSFFGGISNGRINDPLQTRDGVMLVASMDDLMATKLKTIQHGAEAKDYRDIASMIDAGVSLPKALSTFKAMYHGEPRTALMAMGTSATGTSRRLPLKRSTLSSLLAIWFVTSQTCP